MEPVAEFLEDVFILCYAWRYWMAGGCVVLVGIGALLPLSRVRISLRRPKPQAVIPDYTGALHS